MARRTVNNHELEIISYTKSMQNGTVCSTQYFDQDEVKQYVYKIHSLVHDAHFHVKSR